ncbi:MAG TPA: 4Fe-4S dicluster domain-containing protein [Pirellulaceae bacterium]|nr:4Fe-4S dicluster domain-containing protein [Pirellulaceae bacterium]
MPSVNNWQLGRPMDYPHEERHPQWQFAFVFNPNRCIGCQTCTMACKSTWTFSKGQELMWWNNVESKPYGGYPQHWDAKLLEMLEAANPGGQVWNTAEKEPEDKPYGTFQGKTIFEAAEKNIGPDGAQKALGYLPTDDEWRHPNIYEDTPTGDMFQKDSQYGGSATLPEHKVWFFHLARICNHCTYPGCLASCPRNAIYKRPEDGIVLVDQSRCRGYRKCVEGCPYKKVMYRPTTGTSEKCIGCYPRIEGKDPLLSPTGAPAETRCMTACVGKIRLQGLVKIDEDGQWATDPQNPLYYLIRERQVALPLYPQFGTEPNGFYIPPRWVPRGYLVQMFGPGVDHAIEQYSCPDRELLAVLQLFRASQQIIFRFEIDEGPKVAEVNVTMPDGTTKVQEIFNDTIRGFNKLNEEVVRVTVEEPTFERPAEQHVNSL